MPKFMLVLTAILSVTLSCVEGESINDTSLSASDTLFRFAVISDTHFIDDFYTGPATEVEGGGSIYETEEKFLAARQAIKSLDPPVEFVFSNIQRECPVGIGFPVIKILYSFKIFIHINTKHIR